MANNRINLFQLEVPASISLTKKIIAYFKAGKHSKVIESGYIFIKNYGHDLNICFLLGLSNVELAEYSSAIKFFKIIYDAKPLDKKNAYCLGKAFIEIKNFVQAEFYLNKALELDEDNCIYAFTLAEVLRVNEKYQQSLDIYSKIITRDPTCWSAHFETGKIFALLGKPLDAIRSYDTVLMSNPNHALSYFEKAKCQRTLSRDVNQRNQALKTIIQGLTLDPENAEFFYLAGILANEIGNSEDALNYFHLATEKDPKLSKAHDSLIYLLAFVSSKNKGKYFETDKKIRCKTRGFTNFDLSDAELVKIYEDTITQIQKNKIPLDYARSQIYRRSLKEYDCERHKGVFNFHGVIPEFCFSCYKVFVEPRTVLQLVRLSILFDNLMDVNKNTFKCMIEMRPEVQGFYKGYIFCPSLENAKKLRSYLNKKIKEIMNEEFPVYIKHGCTEFAIRYPDFDKSNNDKFDSMVYDDNWKSKEAEFDKQFIGSFINPKIDILRQSLSGLSINDALIMRNWFAYAEKIGDMSFKKISGESIPSKHIDMLFKTMKDKTGFYKDRLEA